MTDWIWRTAPEARDWTDGADYVTVETDAAGEPTAQYIVTKPESRHGLGVWLYFPQRPDRPRFPLPDVTLRCVRDGRTAAHRHYRKGIPFPPA